jgi:uncharacterized membrane protein (Fun14 family)
MPMLPSGRLSQTHGPSGSAGANGPSQANRSDPEDFAASAILAKYQPLLLHLSLGSIMGYSAGYASKKVGQYIAFAIGLGFMGLQAAAYKGYITVDWCRVTKDANKLADLDGDGEFSQKDIMIYLKKLRGVLTHSLPSSSGFTVGFLFGLR